MPVPRSTNVVVKSQAAWFVVIAVACSLQRFLRSCCDARSARRRHVRHAGAPLSRRFPAGVQYATAFVMLMPGATDRLAQVSEKIKSGSVEPPRIKLPNPHRSWRPDHAHSGSEAASTRGNCASRLRPPPSRLFALPHIVNAQLVQGVEKGRARATRPPDRSAAFWAAPSVAWSA